MKNIFVVLILCSLTSCTELNSPSYPGGGYHTGNGGGYGDRNYNGYDRNDDYYRQRERDRLREERKELERERYRVEKERERYERELEKERQREQYRPPPPPPPPQADRCPSGFNPSDRKCSQDERKKGCKDLRNSSGVLCVKR